MSYKSCSKCGKIHPSNHKCNVGRIYSGGEERKLRSTYSWTKKSLEIRDSAHNLCEVCKDKGILTYKSLEVHHIEKARGHEDLFLENLNLICLCESCHTKAESGQIPADYLRDLARQREES